MKLYEFPPTRSIRARWTLQELGVPFESEIVDMRQGKHMQPDYLAVNPAGKLPTLVDGDLVLTESVAIVLYLAERFPEKKLLPTDPKTRADMNRWILFTVTELEQPLWRIAKQTNIYPKEKRVPDDIPLARSDFAAMVKVLEARFAEPGRTFVVGDSVTVADFILAYTLDWANEVKLLDASPNLRAYLERMYERPHAPMRIAKALASVRN